MYSKKELRVASAIIRKIAIDNGISEEKVRADLLEAMNHSRLNPDPAVQEKWKTFHFTGAEPTAEEYLLWVFTLLDDKMEDYI